MIALSGGARLQSLWVGLRRLHQTEVRIDALRELGASFFVIVGRSFRALAAHLIPRFLFVDNERLEVSLLSAVQLRVFIARNSQILTECGLDGLGQRPTADLIRSLPSGRDAVIHATPGCALHKTIAVPADIGGRQLRQTLSYLLEVETPFQREHAYWGFRVGPKSGPAKRLVDLVVAPKSLIDPHIATLRELGIHLHEISYRDEFTSESPICLARYSKPLERQKKRLVGILGILVVLQFITTGALPIVAQTMQASRLNDEMARLSQIAANLGGQQSKLNKAMDPIRQARQDLQTFPNSAAVLRLLQAELGSETVLDRLSLRGAIVQASGSTPSVGLLTERLEKSRALKIKSITRNGVASASQQELFSVSLELATAKGL